MTEGLPPVADSRRPHDAFTLMVIGGVEKMTWALHRGDAFTAKGLDEMQMLRRRLDAFGRALDARCRAAGFPDDADDPDLIED